MKTTNYFNTLIQVADDCPIQFGEVPPQNTDVQTVATLQFEMLRDHPYQYTSDDILFRVYAIKNNTNEREHAAAREEFFSKGQPCFRSSPLTKRYGWGVHSNAEGKIALFAMDSPEYKKLLKDKKVEKVMAMRSKR